MFIFIKKYQQLKAQKHASTFGIFKNNLEIIRSFFSSLMNRKFMRSQALSVLVFALILSIGASSVWAADGSGTNTVSPTSVIVSSTGNTETFTFTASETMDSGGVNITVPSGWSAPQGSSGTAGYTTVTSASGMIATVLDNADATTGWSAGACTTLATDTTTKHEGTASLNCTTGNESTGGVWYKNISAANWSSYTKVGFWIRSGANLSSGRLQFSYDNNNNLASTIENISIPAITANTWTYVVVTFGSTTRTSVASFGFRINNNNALDNTTVRIDDLLIGPGVPTFPGNGVIQTRILQLASTQTVVVTYGSGGGASGVAAPSSAGTSTFTTQSRVSDSGTLTSITSSPTVSVNNPAPTTTSISPTSKSAGDAQFTLTVNGTNFVSASTVKFNGAAKSTTYVSATQLTAVIPASDVATAGAYDVIVTNPTPGGGDSNVQTFTVLTAASKFVILPPTNGTVDASISITIQAQKSDDSVDTTFSSSVTLNTNGSATGGGLITITNGVGTASITDHTAETVHLSLSDSQNTGLDVTSTQDVVFAPGALYKFSLAGPENMNARTRGAFVVTRQDQYSNAVITGSTAAYLYTGSASPNHKFYNAATNGTIITSVIIADTASTASFWYYEDVAGTYTITASDNATTADGAAGIVDGTKDIVVNAVATKFVVTAPVSTTVDTPVVATIQAEKPDNSVDTQFNGAVTLNTSGSATGGGLITITNGVGTATISDHTPETVALSLSDTQDTGLTVTSTANIVFNVGALAQFILNDSSTLPAGTRAAYTASRADQYGNAVSTGSSTVYLYSSSTSANKKFYNAATDGSDITAIVIADGQSSVNFWYYDEQLGTWSVTASDNATAPDSAGIADATDSIQIVPGPVYRFTLNNPGNMTAGTRLGYTVGRQDQFGNAVTSGATTVYPYSTATGGTTAFYTVATDGTPVTSISISDSNSTAVFYYSEGTAGSYTITASDNASAPDDAFGIIDATQGVTVSAAPIVATRFVILPPTSGTVDSSVTVTIQAQDDSGSIDTTINSGVILNITGAATGGGLVSMTSGIGTKVISDHTAETITLSLSDSQGTGLNVSSTQQLVFSPGAVAQFNIDNPGNMAAGTRLGFNVTRKDQYGNLVTAGSNNVYLYSTSTSVNKKFYSVAVDGTPITSLSILTGQSSSAFWYYDELAGSVTITMSDNATAADGVAGIADASQTLTVSPGAISQFLLNNPGNMNTGTRIEYIITRKDQYGNLVTAGFTSAYLYTTSTGTNTAFYGSASGGGSETSTLIIDGQSTVSFWYYDNAAGTWTVTVSDGTPTANGTTGILDASDSVIVSVAPIVATKFIILPVSNSTIRQPVNVTIEAVDDSGNIDTTIDSSVTLVASGEANGGVVNIVNGIGTFSVNDGAVETVTLSLVDSANTGLNISSTQSLTFAAVVSAGSTVVLPTPTVPATPVVSGVSLSGKAFVGAQVNVFAIGGAEPVQKQGNSSANGNFTISFSGAATAGARSFAIIGVDKNKRVTQTKIIDANQANAKAQLTLTNLLLSPTLGLTRSAVTKGDMMSFVGQANPNYTIQLQIDNRGVEISAKADSKGAYRILVSTAQLEFGSHTARTVQVSPTGQQSDFSPQQVFSVVNIFTPNLDLNNDGLIDIKDFSIFLSRWHSSNADVRILDDVNGDGKVDIQDFSIFNRALQR